MMEEWLPVKDFEGLYEVSSLGRVRSFHKSNVKYLKLSRDGKYVCVMLTKPGVRRSVKVQYLVAEAFLGPRSGLVLHKNDLGYDNRVDNLYYGTIEDNMRDAKINGNMLGQRKLTESQVREIDTLLRENILSLRQIGDMYGVGNTTIMAIKRGANWFRVTGRKKNE